MLSHSRSSLVISLYEPMNKLSVPYEVCCSIQVLVSAGIIVLHDSNATFHESL